MKIALFLLINLICNSSYSQSWQSQITGYSSIKNQGISIKLHNNKQYFTGIFENQLDIGIHTVLGLSSKDIFLSKADMDGNTEWLISLIGTGNDVPNHIEIINDTILVSGNFTDTLFIENDTLVTPHINATFIAYFDTLGNYIKSFQPDVLLATFRDFEIDNEGNLILCGQFFQFFNYGNFNMNVTTGSNFFLMKYNPIADSIVWAVNAYGNSSEGAQLSLDENDNIYVVGSHTDETVFIDTIFYSDSINHDLFVAKFNTSGQKEWVRTIGGINECHGFSVICDDSSNVFITGDFEESVDVMGVPYTSNGLSDILVVKLSENGNLLWSAGFGSTEADEGYDLELDQNYDLLLLAEAGMDPSYNGQLLDSYGWNEPLLLKINNDNSELIWGKRLPATLWTGTVNASSMSFENGFIGITGDNRSSITMNGTETFAPNYKDFYTAILGDSLTYYLGLTTKNMDESTFIYPNPTNDFFRIQSDYKVERLEIYSLEGVLVKRIPFLLKNEIVDVSNLTSGIYIVSFAVKDSIVTKKIQIL